MATGPLVWPQCPATCHKGGWDGNRVWPKGNREAGMATGPGHMPPRRLIWQQGLAKWHQGGWDGNRAWPDGTREAWMATGPLVWPQCPVTCHKGGLEWQKGLAKRQHGGWDGKWAWQHATREAEMATGSGQMARGRLGWQQGLVTCHQGG